MPGTDPDEILRVLFEQKILIDNHAGDLAGYLGWALTTATKLRNKIRSSDVDRLVFTPRLWRLQELIDRRDRSAVNLQTGTHPHHQFTNDLLSIELSEKAELFQQAHDALRAEVARWNPIDPTLVEDPELVVVDTSVFISHPAKIREVDYAAIIGVPGNPVRLVVPRVVIDELDRLKESSNGQVRWRAGHTLGVLDELLTASTARVPLDDGRTTVEVFLDDAHHVPLADPDSEIIDRTRALETYTTRRARLLTMDTRMALQARLLGVQVHKLSREIGEEPRPAANRRR